MTDDGINARIARDTERRDPRSAAGARANRIVRPAANAIVVALALLVAAMIWSMTAADGFAAVGGWATTIILMAVVVAVGATMTVLRQRTRPQDPQ